MQIVTNIMFGKELYRQGILFCFILFLTKILFAQDSLDIYLDYTEFYENEEYSFVEIYYSFSRASVNHVQDGTNYTADYITMIEIYQADSMLKSISNSISDSIDSLEAISPEMWINDVYRLLLKKGDYKVNFSLNDVNSKSIREKSIEFSAGALHSHPFFLSNLQLGLQIKPVEAKSRFIKNGYQITPNPARIYNLKWPVLFYYCEIYKSAANDSDNVCYINSEIVDLEGQQIKAIENTKKVIHTNAIVEINKALAISLKSGSYYLKVSLADSLGKVYATQKKLFYVFREADFVKSPSLSGASPNELLQIYQTMSEEQLDIEFKQAEIIATQNEIDIFEDLDLNAKRTFLTEFWKRRQNIPSYEGKNFRSEYMQRAEHANNRFSSAGKEGWETDRGRITLKYGIPDDVERFFGGRENIQYEIWTYNRLEGGAQFFFVDVSKFGRYRLVHSTMLNEIKDYEWRNRYLK